MAEERKRGSAEHWEKVFGSAAPHDEVLAEAIGSVRGDFLVKRWWKYGTPAIDRIVATLETPIDNAAKVFDGIVRVDPASAHVTIEGFPLGIPWVTDGFQFNLNITRPGQ